MPVSVVVRWVPARTQAGSSRVREQMSCSPSQPTIQAELMTPPLALWAVKLTNPAAGGSWSRVLMPASWRKPLQRDSLRL